jgi:hypothetical protein
MVTAVVEAGLGQLVDRPVPVVPLAAEPADGRIDGEIVADPVAALPV